MWHRIDPRRHPVLYVDDVKNNLTVFRLVFSDEFSVLTAESGEEALEILETQPVSVLLADQRMPGMSGIELASIVKNRHPEIVRMLVTAYADSQAAIDAINHGEVWRFIAKPWKEQELRSVLRMAVDYSALGAMFADLQLKLMHRERLSSLGFATAGVAHDMRTPLGTLALGLDLLSRYADRIEGQEQLASEVRRIVGDCRAACGQLRGLVDSIRTRLRYEGRKQRIDPVELAESALKLCRAELGGKALVTFVRREAPHLEGDAVQLGQVLVNLLINAAQSIPAGADIASHRVVLEVGEEEGMATFRISDSGCGIHPSMRDRIFEPFFTTRKEVGGTGLGLAIVRDVVDKHGGRLQLDSEVGKGTTVTVRLPPWVDEGRSPEDAAQA